MNSIMEFRDGRDSNTHSMTKSETTLSESDLLTPSKKSGSSYSHSSRSSSSSGSSFDEDFFQLDGTTKDNTLGQDTSLNGDKEEDIPIIVFSPKSQGSDVGYFGPASPGYVPGTSPDLLTPNESVKQSPPIQVMGRTDDFENSYRIPSSVFARSKSSAQQEWSVASNESLFSIHVGNNSFSREQMVLFRKSGELGKSGELVYPLTKSGQLVFPFNKYGESKSPDSKSGEPHKESGELISYETSAPQAIPPKSANSSMNLGELGVITEAAAETMKEVFRVTAEDRYKEKTPTEGVHNSASVSHRSSASGTSIHSFAFPILTGDRGKSSSAKTDPEIQLEQQPTEPKEDIPAAAPNTRGSRWFSCFSCCHICRC